MPRGDVSDSLINLLLAFIIIYIGAVVLYSLSPLLGILFVLFGLYLLVSGIRRGGGRYL